MSKIKYLSVIVVLMVSFAACNHKPDDNEIQASVTKQLQGNKNYAGVNSAVQNGTVTLSGKCEGDSCAADIEKNIKSIDGVEKVENNVMVDNTTDMTLRTSVQSIITKYSGVQADVAAGEVVLRGSIKRDSLQSLMSDLGALHPKKIDNQLVIE